MVEFDSFIFDSASRGPRSSDGILAAGPCSNEKTNSATVNQYESKERKVDNNVEDMDSAGDDC